MKINKRLTRTGVMQPHQIIKNRQSDNAYPRFDSEIVRSKPVGNRSGSADNLRYLHHRAKEARNRKARALRELEGLSKI